MTSESALPKSRAGEPSESGPAAGRRSTARGAATLELVATEAGVSRATVSRVVNGSPKVNPEIRRNVERAIERLGYVPNAAARSLVTRRSDSVGVVITEPTNRLFTDPFFPRLLRGISGGLAAQGLQLVLLMPDSRDEEAGLERYLVRGHVDGVILVSIHGGDPLPAHLVAGGIPVVIGGRPPAGVVASYVDVDNRDGARTAVRHLAEQGRRRIATIAGPQDMAPGIDRLKGYRDALSELALPHDAALETTSDFTREGGTEAMRRLLEARPDLDAVFAASDIIAAGAMSVLRASGRTIPDQVAVVGYDDSPLAEAVEPALTSIRQPIEEMGAELVQLLIATIEDPQRPARRVLLSTELTRRASSAGRRSP